MKNFFSAFLLLFISAGQISYGQSPKIDSVQFFIDQTPLNATLITNISTLMKQKMKQGYSFPATFICKLPDSTSVNEKIRISVRGHMRREYCYMPPLKLSFHNPTSPILYQLGSLKLVSACKASEDYDQLILREFLVYKMYNLITDKSFRVRLLNMNYEDSSGKKKTISQHAFVMEEEKNMAKRNNCREWKKGSLNSSESTDRRQMTIVAIFQYMIGNTDWAVPANHHNIQLIQSREDTLSRPFAVPYDFDYSGIVNAEYAVPDERIGIENVQVRAYRGFPRSMGEINEVLDIFKKQKDSIYSLINNFEPLSARNKKDMSKYLDDFFYMINKPDAVKTTFLDNARTQ